MRAIFLICLMISFMDVSFAAETTLTIKTPRGAEVEVLISFPEVPAGVKVPAMVAAVGRNYHARLPIFNELRAQGAKAGMAIFTFNWNFFTKGTNPQKPFTNEIEDMQAVLDLAKADPRVDSTKIIVEGKSLGSGVAHRVFQNNPDLFGLHLWTPICETKQDLDEGYPGLASITKPVVVMSGTSDEACSPKVLRQELADAGSNIAVVMVPGDHGFLVGDFKDPAFKARNDANVAAVIAMAVQWAKASLGI